MAHDDVENIGSNRSNNTHLDVLVDRRYSRRSVITGGTATAALLYFSGSATSGASPAAAAPNPPVGFTPVPPSTDDTITVAPEYTAQVFIPWGTALVAGVAWKKDGSNTADEQERMVGFNHDGIHYFPHVDPDTGDPSSKSGLLVLNHEYTDASQIYSAAEGSAVTADGAGRAKVAKALAGHGVTVVDVRKSADGSWRSLQDSIYNRRVTGTTPVTFSGPVPGSHAALASNNEPMGTLNNCGNGRTPWGTYLACEENFNGYFGTANSSWTPSSSQARYGLSSAGFGYNWHAAEARWDIAANPNEANRFGWVVEIDPRKPRSSPVKRTALGRFKHEDCSLTESEGHIVAYMGDDENCEYIYKFISARPWRRMRAEGISPLDEGTLYVARFNQDGTGTWLPLVHGVGALTLANGWANQADILLRAREAGDAVGATPLHRPEWIAVDERTNDVYATLTNGSGFSKSPQNPTNANPAVNSDRSSNPYGHIIRWRERRGDNTSKKFQWDIFVLAGDPEYDAKAAGLTGDNIFGSPDGIDVDPDGRVWIQTDISNSSQNLATRGYDNIGNNQILVANPRTREIKRFMVGPRGCEITGITMTPDRRTLFVNIQHPGESTTYWNTLHGTPSTSNPRTVSNWPDNDAEGRPRSATVVVRRSDGGIVGS